MQKRVKKGISLLLCLLLCVSLLPVSAFAEDGTAAGSELMAEQPKQSGLLSETVAEPEASDSGDENVAIDESNFPDTAFRSYISENVDADSDGFLSPEEIAGVTEISCWQKGLTSLEGIGLFPNLTTLDCSANAITELDVSGNPALETLYCSENQLTELDVSGNPALKNFGPGFNQITRLDLSNNTALQTLYCNGNPLTALDVSNNAELKILNCDYCPLTKLDVSSNPELVQLSCIDNDLTALVLGNKTALETLYCNGNQLTGLDLSGCPALKEFQCGFNQLTALDLSNNTNLNTVSCSGQTVTVESFTQSGEKALFDLSTLVGAENTGRITSVENGDYDPETGTASFDAPGSFTYYFSTGYGDTLMDVSCEYESSPIPNEYGNYHISSFAELKKLAAQEYSVPTYVYYDGSETFVFEEDLTLPVNLFFSSPGADIRIPTGVSVTANGPLNCPNNTLYVEGTLITYSSITVQNIHVSGSLETYETIYIPGSGEIIGEENISSYTYRSFCISYSADSVETLRTILQGVDSSKTNRYYAIHLEAETTQTIEEALTLEKNVGLYVKSPLVIAEGGSLAVTQDAEMDIYAELAVNGALSNTGSIDVIYTENGRLKLGETGSYSGTGGINTFGDSFTVPDEALPGFDLSRFNVSISDFGDEMYYFTLRLKRSLADGPDEYGSYYVANFAELKQATEWELTESTSFYYEGSETFVFEEDLTLSENVQFGSFNADIRIPSGVTVTDKGGLSGEKSILVEGTLITYKSIQLRDTLSVSGSMLVHDTVYIETDTEFVGEENISFYEGSAFSISYYSGTEEDFLAALQEAALNKPHRKYSIHIFNHVFSINEEITVPQNTKVVLWDASTLTVAQGVTLHVEGIISCPGTYYVGEEGEYRGKQSLVINGTVENSGKIYIGVTSRCNYLGELALGETGTYSGTGVIEVYSDTLTSPDEALPGFDLTEFTVADNGEGTWTLTLKTAEETIPGDANGDGEVNTMDLIRLMKYISGAEVDMAEGAGDVNGDGKVNTMDLIRLMKYINGEDVELL